MKRSLHFFSGNIFSIAEGVYLVLLTRNSLLKTLIILLLMVSKSTWSQVAMTSVSATYLTTTAESAYAASGAAILRKEQVETNLLVSTSSTQAVAGVFIRYSDLGIANGSTIYGYSIFATDFTGTATNIVDYTKATCFSTNTDGAVGGPDLPVLKNRNEIEKL